MKNATRSQTMRIFVLLAFVLSVGEAALVAQPERDANSPADQRQQQTKMGQQQTMSMGQSPDLATFSAKIVKSGGKFVLQDSINESTFELDDQKKASAFAGKNVKVTGIVDVATNTIYVAKIEPEL